MYNAHWIHSLPYSKFIELTLHYYPKILCLFMATYLHRFLLGRAAGEAFYYLLFFLLASNFLFRLCPLGVFYSTKAQLLP